MYIPINHSTFGVAAIDTQNTLVREVHLLIGIITDCRSSWIVDFTRKIGICVYLGIKLAWSHGKGDSERSYLRVIQGLL